MVTEILVAIAGTGVVGAAFAWVANTNSDIAVLKDQVEDQAEELETKLSADVAMVELRNITERLQRIERHVLNGSYKDHV
jgi:hypothetical protein